MKKLISITLVLTMILTMCACGAKKDDTNSGAATSEAVSTETASSEEVATEAASSEEASSEEAASETADSVTSEQTEAATDEVIVRKVGVLTMLNIDEEEAGNYLIAQNIAFSQLGKEGYVENQYNSTGAKIKIDIDIVFYDTLDSMLMALEAGDLQGMMIYNSTAQYLCATNDDLQCRYKYNFEDVKGTFAESVLDGHLRNDFSFLMMDSNEALRDEFNSVIKAMKDDGTLDKLIKEQIDGPISGSEVKSITMPKFEGAETIKVAITGSLPPMDYVAADGNPVGFNTAVLAEISQRIGKNIEIVVVDSIGRSTALSSGTVDAVFWTRTNNVSLMLQEMTEEEKSADLEKRLADFSEEELAASTAIREIISIPEYGSIDMPEGTICTESYYSDIFMPVMKKK